MYFTDSIYNYTKTRKINTCLLAAEEGLVTFEISTDGSILLKKGNKNTYCRQLLGKE